MTAISNATPPVISQPPVRSAPVATGSDGDNDGSTAPAASSSSRSPATITSLSPAAQALLSGK